MADEKTRDIEAFERLVDDLDIELSQSADGVYTVCTAKEPLFCFDGDSKEELGHQVINTLISYAKHFLNIDILSGDTESEPLKEAPLPVEVSTPLARIKPVFEFAKAA
jgi:hypothetical protein